MSKPTLAALVALSAVLVLGADAQAQSLIKNPGDHPQYRVELEPHGLFGWANRYGSSDGFGAGARVSIPIVENGFVPTINNSVAITFGLDLLHYSGCYYSSLVGRNDVGCGATFVMLPLAMQWNFWLTPKWSVFGEPGLYVYHGIFDDYCQGLPNCSYPSRTSVDFAFYAGGRFHFNDNVALTMRIGYPTISIGVSFLF